MEDDRVAILEAQLSQAKLIAEEADRKYEEVENNCSSKLVRKIKATIFSGGFGGQKYKRNKESDRKLIKVQILLQCT